MSEQVRLPKMDRRNFLKAASVASVGGLLGLTGIEWAQRMAAGKIHGKLAYTLPVKVMHVGFTDGWASMPQEAVALPPFYPDAAAPSPFTTYVFGIRDLSHLASSDDSRPPTAAMFAQAGKAQISAPFLVVDEGQDFRVHLNNLGLTKRGDLVDSHTLHWHGFPNQIPYFDGVPDNSLSVPIGRQLVYRYVPRDPGTYMYHCHFEDVEHVHMGMTGVVFVRPSMNQGPAINGHTKFAYNDERTWYDREHAILLSEINNWAHWNDRHLQDTDWSEYKANFRLMNGRAFPDTLVPNIDVLATAGSLGGLERLRYQPNSALIQANSGERVLLRISNLGYEEHSLELPGIPMWIVGRDAKPTLSGRPDYGVDPVDQYAAAPAGTRADVSSMTYRLDLGPGESRDVIIKVPTVNPGEKRVFSLYDRNYGFVKKAGTATGDGYGGMRTQIHVYGTTTGFGTSGRTLLPGQVAPNAIYVPSNFPSTDTGSWTLASGTA
jgi:FtsP/CotA-like multicopper oxidase with cupredoxin domain